VWRTFRLARQFLIRNKEYAGIRIQGGRDYQEDDFGFDNSRPNDFLMILADGMGGHQGGAHASHCAVKTFMDSYHSAKGSVAKRLRRALRKANQQLALEAKDKPKLEGMGCTLVGVAISDEQIEWISVGDSPLWLYNAGRLYRLNADHSMKPLLEQQVQNGELTPEEVATHSDRNMLRSALTGTEIELIDQPEEPLELYPGDRLLLASDGILTLSEAEIGQILQKELSAKKLVKELLAAVVDKGKRYQDNTTALVVVVPDELEAAKKQSKSWRWQTSVLLVLLILSLMLWASVQWRVVDLSELVERFSEVWVSEVSEAPKESVSPEQQGVEDAETEASESEDSIQSPPSTTKSEESEGTSTEQSLETGK
jgi:PPM family protein phosphatase